MFIVFTPKATSREAKGRFPKSPVRHSHPQPTCPLPPAHHRNKSTSPTPSELYEFDIKSRQPPLSRTMPKELLSHPTNAWHSNPPSRSGSRANMYTRLPSLNQSQQSVDLDDDIEFHDVGNDTISSNGKTTFFMADDDSSPAATSTPVGSGNVVMRKRRTASVRNRKNGIIPPSGDYELKTQLPISAIMGEFLRVSQVLKMKKAEPTSQTILQCSHRSVDMTVTIRKKSAHNCIVHFEWLSGGNYQSFHENCVDIINKSNI